MEKQNTYKMEKQNTPLSEFPTEALLYMYRKNRLCWTRAPWTTHSFRNSRTGEMEHWIPVVGELELDGVVYNPVVAYERISQKEFQNRYTDVEGNCLRSDMIRIDFEGMHWHGKITEIQNELNSRPHIGAMNAKQFRIWKMNYKRHLNGK